MKLLYIDLFCGAGGTSTGVNKARIDGEQCAEVIACVNHDANAIASHAANHPKALHFTEDIRTLNLDPLVKHVENKLTQDPDSKIVLWASLECTNFSKAKGGQPRDPDSRTLAEHLFRYIESINPDYIDIENVEEFMSWGKMDNNGKPISKYKGDDYRRWVRNVKKYGYNFDFRILNAADFGAYTSRKRFFGSFAKKGLPITFPDPTHSKTGDSKKKKYKAVKHCLDLENEGTSIFRKKKPLSEKTLSRIYAGLIKFVAGGKDSWILKYNSVDGKTGKHNAPGVDEPCPTITCQNRLGLVKCHFLSKQFSGDPQSKNISIEGPAGAITTIDHHALVKTKFIQAYYSTGDNISSIEDSSPVVTTKDKLALVTSRQWILNPQFKNKGQSVDNPCFTLIARMDKMPPYLVSVNTEQSLSSIPDFVKVDHLGCVFIEIYESDSAMTKTIKEFMALYGILDIMMRMLAIPELKRIMGFPEEYVLIGTKAEQKKYIGNAVEVNMAMVLCECRYKKLVEFLKIAA